MLRLTWPDLIIDVAGTTTYAPWLAPWSWLVRGELAPRFLSRLGCWFLQRPDGSVELLDVFYGQLEPVADSFAAFQAMVTSPSWQEVYLFSDFVHRLHLAGKVATGTSSYALAPPPLAGGPDPWADPAAIPVMWQRH